MENEEMTKIIDEYIKAYNKFNVENMIKDLHEDIEFKNIANGEVNLELKGKIAFKNQAEQAVNLFEKREMKITEQVINGDAVENKIDFSGVVAMDIPEGPKAGAIIELKGTSNFKFKDGKIILIEDIS